MERETIILLLLITCVGGVILILKNIMSNNTNKTSYNEKNLERAREIARNQFHRNQLLKTNETKSNNNYTENEKVVQLIREYLTQTNDEFEFDNEIIKHISFESILKLTISVHKYVTNLKKSIDGGFTMDMFIDLSFDENHMLKYELQHMMSNNLYDVFNKRFVSSLFIVLSDSFDLQKDKDLVYFLYETSVDVLSRYDNNPS